MPQIEGFQVHNYRSLQNVKIGRIDGDPTDPVLTRLTAVIGKNGSGKSSLLDAFGFIADALDMGVEAACDQNYRGGFERIRTKGTGGAIGFSIGYRENPGAPGFYYHTWINLDEGGRPFVEGEMFSPSPVPDPAQHVVSPGYEIPILALKSGAGKAWDGKTVTSVNLSDTRQLGIATLGSLRDHPQITQFRDFLKSWYLSYFQPDAARGALPIAGPQRHLNTRGDNLGNVVQYMEQKYKDRFASILQRIAERIPGITSINTVVTEDKRVLLRFNDGAFQDPFYAQQMSDGTLKLFAYMLMMEDPEPPPFICIEEPENGLYHRLLDVLVREFRELTERKDNPSQVLITTHQPYLLDALKPEEVWLLEKGADGFSHARHVSDLEIVRNMVAEGLPLGGLWYSDYLDQR